MYLTDHFCCFYFFIFLITSQVGLSVQSEKASFRKLLLSNKRPGRLIVHLPRNSKSVILGQFFQNNRTFIMFSGKYSLIPSPFLKIKKIYFSYRATKQPFLYSSNSLFDRDQSISKTKISIQVELTMHYSDLLK